MAPAPGLPAHRFVPTLTEVIPQAEVLRLYEPPAAPANPAQAATAPMAPRVDPSVGAASLAVDVDQLARQIETTVLGSLDDHIRSQVADVLQAQQMLMVQSLRTQLQPMVESLVHDALQAHLMDATNRQI